MIEKRLLIVAGAYASLRQMLLTHALAPAEGVPHLLPIPHTKYANGVRLGPFRPVDALARALDFLRAYEPLDVVTSEPVYCHEIFCREAAALGYAVSLSILDLPSFKFRSAKSDRLLLVAPWVSGALALDGTRAPAELVSLLRSHPSVALIREPSYVERSLGRKTAGSAPPS